MQHWNRMPDALKEQVFDRLEGLAAVANLSEENRIAYGKALDRYRVSRIVEEDAREAGWKKGLEEGRAAGLMQGREEGRAEAHAETTRAIARNMKGLGISMEHIIKVTGLSEHEISAL